MSVSSKEKAALNCIGERPTSGLDDSITFNKLWALLKDQAYLCMAVWKAAGHE